MWIVRLALRNPYSVAVMAAFFLVIGVLCALTMLTDIFPNIDIPVVSVIWSYPGLTAEQMETQVVTINERAFSTTVQGISKMESQSMQGIGNLRVYFQPGTDIASAVAQSAGVCETILKVLPPGITPPNILPFNAASVPIAELILSGEASEQELYDYGLNFLRLRLFTIPGLATPAPYGGAQREINVNVDPALAAAKGISPFDVASTLQAQNIIEPAGTARIGKLEYNVLTNSSPTNLADFGRFPIKIVNGRQVRLADVAKVQDSHADQINLVDINGSRAAYLNILKKSGASTLAVMAQVKSLLPSLRTQAPHGIHLDLAFDQSTFVRLAIKSVLREAVSAAILVSIMVLVFLGNWRSVLIVCTSIPLSILASVIGLKLTGNSINIMTLGGLALSIGMLVDDATVEIENTNRNRQGSENITVAILRGARQIALPAIVTTLSICIVFFPIVLLTGPAKFLFTPLSEAVVFAMLISYVLSRTLVPTLARILLRNVPIEGQPLDPSQEPHGVIGRLGKRFNERREYHLEKLKNRYGALLSKLLDHPRLSLGAFGIFVGLSLLLPIFVIGTDFFPATDSGMLRFHFRAPSGSRIEETERIVNHVESRLRQIIPAEELDTINANIGVPTPVNIAYVPTDNTAAMDAEILVALKENHRPSAEYRRKIRDDFAATFPGSVIYFEAADIVSQVLNFGLTAPIDIQLGSSDIQVSYDYAKKVRDKVRLIPGTADAVIRQVTDYPTLQVKLDRDRSAYVGLTARDATSSLLFALTGSGLVAPNYYINPDNHVNYQVVTKFPLRQVSTLNELLSVPITPGNLVSINQSAGILPTQTYPAPPTQSVGNLSEIVPTLTMSQINHVNVQRVVDVIANTEGRDLGGVVGDIEAAIRSLGKIPNDLSIRVLGQNEVMKESFTKLGIGMILAGTLVYLLMVTLFQSWLDPLIIMVAIPGALSGIAWMLALTRTTINVESLMGTIMAIGIAVSNSNLMVNFANDFRIERRGASPGDSSRQTVAAALEAGKVRLRPILMTALAMTLGMLPMALGSSGAGSQNAPLGRAVIGGLVFSTLSTLFIVPVTYALLRKGLPTKQEVLEKYLREEAPFNAELRREIENALRPRLGEASPHL